MVAARPDGCGTSIAPTDSTKTRMCKAAGQLALLHGKKDVPLQLIKCSELEIPVAARSHVPTFFLCFEKSLLYVNEAYSQMFGYHYHKYGKQSSMHKHVLTCRIGCEDIIFGVQRNGFTWLLVR